MSAEPNPRFNQYTEIIKNDEVVGFKLDNNDFQFLFDKYGGWFDESGTYYNVDAIQCQPPQIQSDDQSQTQQKQEKDQFLIQGKMIQLKINNQNNDRIQVIRNFQEIIETYPENQQIVITYSLQPLIEDDKKVIEEFIQQKIGQKVTVENNSFCGILDHELATKIVELEGSVIEKDGQKYSLYLYVDLFDSIEISVKIQKAQLQLKLNELGYEKNSDYANVTEEMELKEVFTFLQIRKDIADQLKEDIDYKLEID